MSKTKKIALGALLAALGVSMCVLGSVLDVLDLTMVALSSLCIVAAVIEMGGAWPWLVYAVTAALALVLCPTKTAPIEYILFGGLYPIIKAKLECYHPAVTWTIKLSYFNTAVILLVFVANFVLGLPDTGLGYTIAVFALANVFFVVYDIALSKLITLYIVKLRKKLGLRDLFK